MHASGINFLDDERAIAWRALEFVRSLARETEGYHRALGLFPTWRFKEMNWSARDLRGTEREPPSLTSIFWVYGKGPLGLRWKQVFSLQCMSLRDDARNQVSCLIYEHQLTYPRMREDIYRFAHEALGAIPVRFYELHPESEFRRKGHELAPYSPTRR